MAHSGYSSTIGTPVLSPVAPAATWEWQNEKANVWVPYLAVDMERLNAAFARGEKFVTLGQQNYQVNLEKFPYVQTNNISGNSHLVRRMALAMAVPIAPVPSALKEPLAFAKPAAVPPVAPAPSSSEELSHLCALAFERPTNAMANTKNLQEMLRLIKKIFPTINARDEKQGYSPLVCAVVADRVKAVDLLLDNGADIDYPTRKGVTALEAAIQSKLWEGSEMVRHLLSRGASVQPIKDRLNELKLSGVMKYWIQRVLTRLPITPEKRARLWDCGCQHLPELEMAVIGQQPAVTLLSKLIQAFMANREGSGPLVIAFCGPSGHGKTELARRLAEVMFKDRWLKVSMERVQTKWDLTGSGVGYANNDAGAALNNFLVDPDIAKEPNVVFLDEFEKTGSEVRQALLNVWDKGEWLDNRSHKPYHCNNTVWIVATNAVDDVIQAYFKTNPGAGSPECIDHTKTELSGQCQKRLQQLWTNPVAGRIHCIVPFLPFSPAEQLVLAESMMLEQIKVYAQKPNEKRKVGNLKIEYSPSVVQLIANAYSKDTGARAITTVLKRDVDTEVCSKWTEHGMNKLWITTVQREGHPSLTFSLTEPPMDISALPAPAAALAPVMHAPTAVPPPAPDFEM